MPDLATHISIAYLVNKKLKLSTPLILFGAVLPDISRALLIIFPAYWYEFDVLHTPLASLLMIALFSLLFKPGARRVAVLAIFLGVVSHYLLDLFQTHFAGGYLWLFPFSTASWEAGLITPESSLLFLPFLLILVGVLVLRQRSKAKG